MTSNGSKARRRAIAAARGLAALPVGGCSRAGRAANSFLPVPADVSCGYEHARMANPHAATRILSWRSLHGTLHRKQLIVESVEHDGI